MQYELKTNRGIAFTFESDTFNPSEYINGLNQREVLTVALGEMVTHKNNIQSIAPIYPEGAELEGIKLDIFTNQGEIIQAYVGIYNPATVSASLNDTENQFVLFGEAIIHKHNANLIMPAKTEEETVV